MRRNAKRLLIWAGGSALAGFLLLNLVAYNHASAMMHFSARGIRTAKPEALSFKGKCRTLLFGVNIPRPSCRENRLELGAESVPLRIPCPDGPILGAWYCPVKEAKCLIILFHGYTADKSSLVREGKAFLDLGCSVLLVDFRGSGESSESYTTIGFREGDDVAAAVQYARHSLTPGPIVLFGGSMGAAAILRAIASCGVSPDAVILEAVFDSLLHTVRNRFDAMGIPSFPCAELLVFWGGRQASFDGFAHNPIDYAAKVTCPVLLMHGSDDPRARLGEARSVFNSLSGPKRFKAFPSAGHESYLAKFPDEWRSTVRHFLSSIQTIGPSTQVEVPRQSESGVLGLVPVSIEGDSEGQTLGEPR